MTRIVLLCGEEDGVLQGPELEFLRLRLKDVRIDIVALSLAGGSDSDLAEVVGASSHLFTLVLGPQALRAVRPGLPFPAARGRAYIPDGNRVVFTTFGPRCASQHRLYERELQKHLGWFAELTNGERHPLFREDCARCGRQPDEMTSWHCDDTGVAFCQDHVPKE